MTQLMLDPAILDKHAAMKDTVELCYPNGRVAGDFVPRPITEPAAWQRPPIPDKELDQRKREGGVRWRRSWPTWRSGHELHGHLGAGSRARVGGALARRPGPERGDASRSRDRPAIAD